MGKSRLKAESEKLCIGRPRLFTDPQQLLELFVKYLEWNAENPVEVTNERGAFNVERPLSTLRFCLFAKMQPWRNLKEDYAEIEGFGAVITYIESFCTSQQIEGACCGRYKENLVARLNGLTDKQEIKASVNAQRSVEEAYAELYGKVQELTKKK